MARNLRLEVVLKAVDRATRPIKAITGSSTGLARTLKETREALKGLQGQQKDISSFRALRGQAEQTAKAMQASRNQVRQLSQQMASTNAPTKALTGEFQRAVRQAQALKAKHGEQQQALQALRGRLNEAGISTRKLGEHERELRGRIASTNASLSTQTTRLQALTRQQDRLTRAKQQYARTQQRAASLAGAGAGAGVTGYAMGRPLGGMLGTGMEFDTTMSRVQALTRLDKGADELAMLRKQARELGARTLFTSTQVAEGQAFLGMAGFDPDKIKAAMPGILDMAKAGGMDIGETADIGSNILTGMNLQADQMGKVADVITAAFTRSNTSISTLGETMKYAAPGAAQFGVSLETTAAMAAKLGDAGIQGSMGGTSIRRMIGRLAAPNKAARAALDKLGVTAQDAQGNMRDLPEVLQEIYEKSRHMGDIERGSLWKAIAGETGSNAMGILVDQAGTGKLQELIEVLRASEGEAAQVAGIMAANLAGDWDQLKSAWADVGIELFEQQDSALRDLARSITGVIRAVGDWARENPELASTLTRTLGIIAAIMVAIGGLSLALAGILAPLAILKFSMAYLGIKGGGLLGMLWNLGKFAVPLLTRALLLLGRALLLNPIGLAITAVALIYTYWEPITAFFAGLWAEIKAAFDGGIVGIIALLIKWNPLNLIRNAFKGVLDFFGIELPGKFTGFGGMLIDGLIQGFKAAFPSLASLIGKLAEQIPLPIRKALGIHSPSRVFAEIGGHTMTGLTQGLAKGEGRVLSQIAHTADQLGAGITFDRRPALSTPGRQPASSGGATYNITVNAAPGQDAEAIARAVAQELDKRERATAARRRSALYDQE